MMSKLFLDHIAGKWVECKSRKTFPNTNPANRDEVVGLFQSSGAEDVEAACGAAQAAQAQSRETCRIISAAEAAQRHRERARGVRHAG
jgi:acyl-CoA reductase-like NAD-dependent aldehyde dehydrogenase